MDADKDDGADGERDDEEVKNDYEDEEKISESKV
jgi:hypothetical protein